jgi:hypothetical protein
VPDGPRLPDFLIVGAAKCGTTSLASWLGAHPQIYVPPIKEVGYFATEQAYARGENWYRGHFADAGDALAVGEATPNYMFYPWSVEWIANDLPDVRVIVCLRNPTDRAYSHYLHWRDRLMLEPRTFAGAIEQELAYGGSEVALHEPRRDPPYFGYLARGRYDEQIERLTSTLGPDRVHVVLLDDMKADPAASYASVCRFIGVDDAFAPANLGASENRYQRHRGDRVLRPLVRRRARRFIPRVVWRWLVRRVFPAVEVPAPAADPATRARVVEFFRPHNAALASRLGRDLGVWDR